jgi:hypothetical protein
VPAFTNLGNKHFGLNDGLPLIAMTWRFSDREFATAMDGLGAWDGA